MRKTPILIMAGFAVAALAVIVVRQQGQLQEARQVAAQAEQRVQAAEAKAAEAKAATQSARKEEEQVLQRLRTAEAEVKTAAEPVKPTAPGTAPARATTHARHSSTNDVAPFAGIAICALPW